MAKQQIQYSTLNPVILAVATAMHHKDLAFKGFSVWLALRNSGGLLDIEACELRTQLSFICQQWESVLVAMETGKPFPLLHYEHWPFYLV